MTQSENNCHFRISELIVAKLSRTISEVEERELDSWRSASESNERLYRKITDSKRFLQYIEQSREYDYLSYFAKLDARMAVRKNGRKVFRRMTVAAAVLIPLAALLTFMPRSGNNEENITETLMIEPGSARALLTLGDGTTVDLGKTTARNIATGVVVEEDTLNYNAQEEVAAAELHTVYVPRGGEYFIKFSDGSRVWLNSETTLKYLSSFGSGERQVQLEGEAYFEVAPDAERPFKVKSAGQEVSVIGTSFAVRAYADEEVSLTTIESGAVKVVPISLTGETAAGVRITPPNGSSGGNQTVVRNGEIELRRVNPALYTAWRKGSFLFVDQELGEILSTLSRWYDLDIVYTQPGLDKLRFTGELKRYSSAGELLAIFETIEKVRFSVTGSTVTVTPY